MQDEREPLAAVAVLGRDLVHEARENTSEGRIASTSLAYGAERDLEASVVRVDLDGHVVGAARVERAQDRELQVVRPLVRKLGTASNAAEDQCRHVPKTRVRRDREHDAVAHQCLHWRREIRRRDHLDSFVVATSGEFDVRSESVPGGATVVHVAGEVDLATAPRLEEALAGVESEVVVIDLSHCTFLDSAGIRTLVGAERRLSDAGRSLRIVSVDPGIIRLLEITAVDSLIAVHPSLDDAL